MKNPTPEKEHEWLQKLVGEWTYEFEAPMKPGDPPTRMTGSETVRSIGDLWIIAEGKGQMPDGTPSTTLLTLGFDPEKKRFVGTWLGSMMTYLWVYEGTLEGDVLTLETFGPTFAADRATARFRERIELAPDRRIFSSEMEGADGNWQPLMQVEYRRA